MKDMEDKEAILVVSWAPFALAQTADVAHLSSFSCSVTSDFYLT